MKTTCVADACEAYRESWLQSFCEAMDWANGENHWAVTQFVYSTWSIAKTGFLQETSHPVEQLGSMLENAVFAIINVAGAAFGAIGRFFKANNVVQDKLNQYSFGDAWDCTILTFQHAFKTVLTAVLWIGKCPTAILLSVFRPEIILGISLAENSHAEDAEPNPSDALDRSPAPQAAMRQFPVATPEVADYGPIAFANAPRMKKVDYQFLPENAFALIDEATNKVVIISVSGPVTAQAKTLDQVEEAVEHRLATPSWQPDAKCPVRIDSKLPPGIFALGINKRARMTVSVQPPEYRMWVEETFNGSIERYRALVAAGRAIETPARIRLQRYANLGTQ